MEIKGNFKAFGRLCRSGREIAFDGSTIRYTAADIRTDVTHTAQYSYEAVSCDYMLPNASCHEIRICSEDSSSKPDLVYHVENVDGKEIHIVSEMFMEYDGRGRIVGVSYIKEEDLPFVNDSFESRLYKSCNNRTPVSMMNPEFIGGAGMMNMMGMMNSGLVPGMGSAAPAEPSSAPAVSSEPWDCICGEKGNTGNFCRNCGMKRPG